MQQTPQAIRKLEVAADGLNFPSEGEPQRRPATQSAIRLTLAVIDPRSLTREALVGLLETVGAFRVIPVADSQQLSTLTEDVSADIDIAILNLGPDDLGDERTHEDIAFVHQALPQARVIVICDRVDSKHISEALRLNVRGYVPTTLTSQILMGALRLVEAGGTFVPATALTEALTNSMSPSLVASMSVPEVNPSGLTPRQRQVLALLRKGKPNKLIAHELSMRESTVKVHVRQIMRKMNVTNRTEAALLSLGTPKDE